MRYLFRFATVSRRSHLLSRHYKAGKAPSPATPPRAPKKPQKFSFHGMTWEDPYSWMSNLSDKVAMRHMDVYMEQEEKYTEAVMADSERLLTKLHLEMASRMPFDLSTPPFRWGPWCVTFQSSPSSFSCSLCELALYCVVVGCIIGALKKENRTRCFAEDWLA